MRFIETPVDGAYIIEPTRHADERGTFAMLWGQAELVERGLRGTFVQGNHSFSPISGTLRGLHWQAPPHSQAKLIRCVAGSVFDVIVDLRPESPTFLRWAELKLSARDLRLAYVPEKCAHGYLTLEGNTEVLYLVSTGYHPEVERGIRWDDPLFKIDWPAVASTVSPRDLGWPDYVA
ncbi:MAG TPA: dTDP-4-dehydrorhamnose 3,5-epimerase [Vicinamibacterales bacterium]|jgi:dTDP-4-dehydrorhamnose 3,5-epimerase|nr:dTDP-4-dehydrorhamnose 3,5-epimerase [Vicinamibacterales bacterium]